MYSFCFNVKTLGWFRRVFKDDLPFTQWLALFCYVNVGKKGVPNPFHGCLWTIEYSKHTLSPLHTQKQTCIIFSSPDDLIFPKENQSSMFDYLINQANPRNKCKHILISSFNTKKHTACKVGYLTVKGKSYPPKMYKIIIIYTFRNEYDRFSTLLLGE